MTLSVSQALALHFEPACKSECLREVIARLRLDLDKVVVTCEGKAVQTQGGLADELEQEQPERAWSTACCRTPLTYAVIAEHLASCPRGHRTV